MDRRTFIKGAALSSASIGLVSLVNAADLYFPSKVDKTLFEGINRVKDPAKKTHLEETHAPFIVAPRSVKADEPFAVEVSVGESLHIMTPSHWIEYIQLSIGNEPAGRIDFQPKGYMQPKVKFNVVLSKEAAPDGKVTLVAAQHCNLHGTWESTFDVKVT
jgi:superoxide reductase